MFVLMNVLCVGTIHLQKTAEIAAQPSVVALLSLPAAMVGAIWGVRSANRAIPLRIFPSR